jgi:hypothetical protein
MLSTSMLGDYSTSASLTPSYFLRTDLLGNLFASRHYSTYFFLLFFFLDHHAGHPARHDAQILLMSASSMPSEFFSSSFRSIGSLLPTAHHSTSLRFSKTSNRSAAKLICFFFLFGPTCMLFDLPIALRLRHDLSKVVAPTPRSGACETLVPWVPTDQAHGRPR